MPLPIITDYSADIIRGLSTLKGTERFQQASIVGTVPADTVGTVALSSQVLLTSANTWFDGPVAQIAEAGTYLISARGLIYRGAASGIIAHARLWDDTNDVALVGGTQHTIDGIGASPHVFQTFNFSIFASFSGSANVVLQGASSIANATIANSYIRANSGIGNNIEKATVISWFKVGP